MTTLSNIEALAAMATADDLVSDISAAMQWAYCEGADAVHENWTDDAYPEFGEAASDTVSQSDALESLSIRIIAMQRENEALRAALVRARPYISNVVEADGFKFNRDDLAAVDAALEPKP